ncbi:MAG: hypothetical protein BWZ10_01324 [candidate division BRC1 bacterium ADurb.BinA364]|nr:MAG: hypothetical protein BWZ10_01324 [candidate division BRC1 bacterium ADurb.BinA364]
MLYTAGITKNIALNDVAYAAGTPMIRDDSRGASIEITLYGMNKRNGSIRWTYAYSSPFDVEVIDWQTRAKNALERFSGAKIDTVADRE